MTIPINIIILRTCFSYSLLLMGFKYLPTVAISVILFSLFDCIDYSINKNTSTLSAQDMGPHYAAFIDSLNKKRDKYLELLEYEKRLAQEIEQYNNIELELAKEVIKIKQQIYFGLINRMRHTIKRLESIIDRVNLKISVIQDKKIELTELMTLTINLRERIGNELTQ